MIKRMLLLLLLLGVIAYLVLAITWFSRPAQGLECRNLVLVVKDTARASFVSKEELKALLTQKDLYPVGRPLKQVQTALIEEELRKHPMADKVECYVSSGGDVCIAVTQRNPILRVFTASGDTYYVDEKGGIMPATGKNSVYVPVATGMIEKGFAEKELYRFALFLQENPFWNAQIEQIYVRPGQNIELVPRVGNHLIYMGKLQQVEQKLERLKKFYQKGLNQVGWDKYSYINVEFGNQIICTKRESADNRSL